MFNDDVFSKQDVVLFCLGKDLTLILQMNFFLTKEK